MKTLLGPLIAIALLTTPASLLGAEEHLADARQLYASADYDEALAALTRLRGNSPDAAELEQIDQYRAFALFALGRTAEAQAVTDDLIKRNPGISLDPSDASPRITAMFADARKRLLPEIVRSRYRTAKTALDRKDYAAAEPQLLLVKEVLAQSEAIGALDETSAALRDVVDGFLELMKASRPAAPPAAVAQVKTSGAGAEKSEAAPAESASAPVFGMTSPGVGPPVAVVQAVPPIPQALISIVRSREWFREGARRNLDIIIDQNGDVEEATLTESIHPAYDKILLNAAKQWKYKPATKDGAPVKFEKLIAISVAPAQQ